MTNDKKKERKKLLTFQGNVKQKRPKYGFQQVLTCNPASDLSPNLRCILMMEKLLEPNFHQEVTQLPAEMSVQVAPEPEGKPPIPPSKLNL